MQGVRTVRFFLASAALFVAAPLLAGCAHSGGKAARSRPTAPPIPTVAVKEATVRATSTISGVIAPFQNVAITSSLTEPADSVNVLEGDRVKAGQVLAVLDTADLRAQLAQAQSTIETDVRNAASADAKVVQTRYQARLNIGTGTDQVTSARAALAQAEHTLAQARQDLGRYQDLIKNGYITQQTVDQQATTTAVDAAAVRNAQAALATAITNEQVNGNATAGLQAADVASAIADANAAHATIGQAQALARQYQTSIDKATIVSPTDGVVVNRNLNPGEYPGGRTLFTVQKLDPVYAMLNASSSDTFSIPIGAPVTLSVSGSGTQTYRGKVAAVLGQVTPGSTNFTIEVIVANPALKLQSGLPVTAVTTLPAVHGLGIPTKAFLDDTHTTVMIADDEIVDKVAKTVTVRELGSDGTTSIVSGLKSGDTVVANGQLGLSDGQTLAEQ